MACGKYGSFIDTREISKTANKSTKIPRTRVLKFPGFSKSFLIFEGPSTIFLETGSLYKQKAGRKWLHFQILTNISTVKCQKGQLLVQELLRFLIHSLFFRT